MPTERICSECGAGLSPDAQGGLCVRCLFTLGLKTEAGTEAPAPVALVTEKAGDRIGRYKLLEKIGEGGCGVVYMAEQEEPVRRRVALKVIKLGMDTREVIARFEAERQALAMMDHPNIAKIFDAGSTERPLTPSLSPAPSGGEGARRAGEGLSAGRPYFVMELVKGTRITEYCDQHNLPTRERLDLFIKVCQAIQHAHQKGIIHRDIKPSNILVTVNDGVPVPKVIDFGIAKATEGRLTDKTLFTAFQQFMGTPAYMSPEQAEMTSLDIDTRSDIYSLGVLLYELLTGKTPFDAKELLASGLDAMRRIIREQEPPRPSTRLSTLLAADQTEIARRRQTDPPKLLNLLRGDLDWIVMKALEKDRTRRYDTAYAFALDVRRFLASEPVIAAAPSKAYRFERFAERNKTAISVAYAIAIILFAATMFSIWQAVRASQEVKKSNQREAKAVADGYEKEEALRQAEAMSALLVKGFNLSQTSTRDGRMITVAEVLDKAAEALNRDLRATGLHRARLQAFLGDTYNALGMYRSALPLLEQARNYYRTSMGNYYLGSLSTMDSLADCYANVGRPNEALKMREDLLPLNRMMKGPQHHDTLWTMLKLANAYVEIGRRTDALNLHQQALTLTSKILSPDYPDSLWTNGNLTRDEARSLREALLTLGRKLGRLEQPEMLAMMNYLASFYFDAARRDEALKLREEMLPLRGNANGPEHPDTLRTMNGLAVSYIFAGRQTEAEALLRKALAILRKQSASKGAQENSLLGATLCHLADVLRNRKGLPEARALAEEAVGLYRHHSDWPLDERKHALETLDAVLAELKAGDGLEAHQQGLK